jgi:PTH2 family peptidyl-tRNA hydrolase
MMKQIIVIRNDLNMRKGKMCSQAAHASLGATLGALNDPRVHEWLNGLFTKICVRCDSEEELDALHEQAKSLGLINCLITDSGKTEFNGVPTKTCLAIGPDTEEKIDAITGSLKLL